MRFPLHLNRSLFRKTNWGILVDHFGAFPLIGTSLLLTKGFEILFICRLLRFFAVKNLYPSYFLINLITNVTLNLLYLPFSEILSPIYLSIFLFFLRSLSFLRNFSTFKVSFFTAKKNFYPFYYLSARIYLVFNRKSCFPSFAIKNDVKSPFFASPSCYLFFSSLFFPKESEVKKHDSESKAY